MLTVLALSALQSFAGAASPELRQSTLFGISVCSIADLDSDGVRDVAVGDPLAAGWSGEVAVLSGRTGKILQLLSPRGVGAAFGFAIESATTESGGVFWAVSAYGWGGDRAYVDVFVDGVLEPVMHFESRSLDGHFGGQLVFVSSSPQNELRIVVDSFERAPVDLGGYRNWRVGAWSVPAGIERWSIAHTDRPDWRQPWFEGVRSTRGSVADTLIFSSELQDRSARILFQVDQVEEAPRDAWFTPLSRTGPMHLAGFHLDADGRPEVLVGLPSGTGDAPGEAVVLRGGSGDFVRRHTGTESGYGSNVAVLGDLDCDNVEDYGIASFGTMEPGSVSVHSGADGTLLRHWLGDPARIRHQHFGNALRGVDDLDGDGTRDVVVGSVNHEAPYQGGSVWAYSGRTGDVLWCSER